MDGVLNFFGSEAGQRRRAALADLSRNIGYYIPPELRGLLGAAAEMTPTSTLERAAQASERMFGPDRTTSQRVGDLGAMLSETAGIVAPAVVAGRAAMPAAQAVQEGLLGFSMGAQDVGRAVVDRLNQPGQMPTLYSNPLLGPIGAGSGGIRAYQGSPHDFAAERLVRYPDGRTEYIVGRPDVLPDVPAGAEVLRDFPMGRMRMDKIGTGEGAQAFGHGLYFAEAEPVARGYRDALSGVNQLTQGGTAKSGSISDRLATMFGNDGSTWSRGDRNIGDYAKRLAVGSEKGEDGETIYRFADGSTFIDFGDFWDVSDAGYNAGRMYEVSIRANPEDFLDWDKPLSEQSEKLQNIVLGFEGKGRDLIDRLYTMASDPIHAAYQRGELPFDEYQRSNPNVQVAERLREAGIPGIRYLDAGSRGAGDGSRNYVVFNENLIEIVRKYGIAGAAALLGLSVADIEAAMAAPAPDGLLAQEPRQ